MDGKQQHYLPQFLQKQFRFRSAGPRSYVHCHEKTRSFQPNTLGIGQEHYFYGDPDESSADANLAALETQFAENLQRWLSSDRPPIEARDAAPLIATLAARTKAFRSGLADLAPRLASKLREMIESGDLLRAEFRKFLNDQKQLDALIQTELRKLPPMDRNLRAAHSLRFKSEFRKRAEVEFEPRLEEIRTEGLAALRKLETEAGQKADEIFLSMFSETEKLASRNARFENYEYSLQEAGEEEVFVLGDCAVVGWLTDGSMRLAMTDIDEDIRLAGVFLPISPSVCLVGTTSGSRPQVSAFQLNAASASLSVRFFVSNLETPPHLERLRELIGTAAPLLELSELDRLASEISEDGKGFLKRSAIANP